MEKYNQNVSGGPVSKEASLQNKDIQIGRGIQRYLNTTVLFGLILLLGITLRFYDLGAESYWIDEMFTVIEGHQSIFQLLASGRLDQPPAFYLPFHLWVQLFGYTEIGTRSFSALAGIGSIVLIYMVGRELFGKEVGLLGAFFMAITEFQIHFSQLARFYSFFEFMTLLSFLFFIRAFRSKKVIYFLLYGLASIIMVYSHTFGLFILVAQNLFFLTQEIKNRNAMVIWLICQVLIALTLLPYLFSRLFGAGGIKGAVESNLAGSPAPTIFDPMHFMYSFILPGRGERSWESLLVNFAIAGAFLVLGIWIYAVRQGMSEFLPSLKGWANSLQEVSGIKGNIFLVSCWLLCPMVLPFIASLVIAAPMYEVHYTISAAPAVYLLLALGLFSIRKMVPLIISLGALIIVIVPGLVDYYRTDTNEQWRQVAVYVEENSELNDVIVFAPNMGIGIQQRSFDWYYRGPLQGCGLDSSVLVDSRATLEALMRCVFGHQRFWVIIPNYPTVTSDERFKSFFLNLNQTTLHKIKEQQFVGLSVYLFELRK